MARTKNNIFNLSGSLGGITFTRDEFGPIVKKKTEGPYNLSQGTIESSVEFGGASMVAKVFRHTLNTKKLGLEDRYFSGRLSGKVRKVAAMGEGLRGKRKIDLRKNGEILTGFEFIRQRPLAASIGSMMNSISLNKTRNKVFWCTPRLNIKKQITAPKTATHLRFILCLVSVSNYHFCEQQSKYAPLTPEHKGFGSLIKTESIILDQIYIEPVSLKLELPTNAKIQEEVGVICSVGVEFLTNENGEFVVLEGTNSMKIIGVY